MLLTLIACVNLSGNWEGELDCQTSAGNYEVDVSFQLSPDDGGFSGDGVLDFRFTSPEVFDLVETMTVSFTRPDHGGPQDLDYDVRGEDCTVSVGGLSLTTDCSDAALTDADIEWDGADALTLDPDDGDCDGEVTRGG